jgi:iron(III) transport system ATP-binding protein
MQIADQIAVVNAGRIQQLGTPAEVYTQPTSRFIANFVGTSNEFAGTVTSTHGTAAVINTKLGDVTATMADGEHTVGDDVVGVWRPESGELLATTAKAENAWPVKVDASLYMGTYIENVMRAAEGSFRQRSTDQTLREVGDEFLLHVDKKDIRLFTP